ncbi:hypothetical protein OVA07_02685 [Novosphingobium sp. SL115]|nr:hypothetical protein [Novosphingobium sp. SL115]MCY1669914.1 hypothetical protein [Novosphingobium sp. SL115]
MEKGGWVYIMANRSRGGVYVGVTSDLFRRVWKFALIEADSPDWLDLWDQWHPAIAAPHGGVKR